MERITRFVLGPLLVLGGMWFIALPFAFATMLNGDSDALPDWREYLGAVWRVGVSSLSWGLILILGGVYLAAKRCTSTDQEEGTKKL